MTVRALVAIKRVVDPNVRVRVLADGSGVDLNNVKMGMNPFCEIALEEALKLREAGHVEEVVLVTIGSEQAVETLRAGLAMGADRGILVKTSVRVEPLGVAKCLAAVVREEQPRIVLLGKQAIDDDANQTGQMLGGILGWGQGTFASRVDFDGEAVVVTREVDEGLETVRISLPAVVTVDLRLNQPRYASLPNIMKAKKKPISETSPEALGVDVSPRHAVLATMEPAKRKAGRIVASVDELVQRLRTEAGLK